MPNLWSALAAAVMLLCGLGGLMVGGGWRWLAMPSILFLGFTIAWSLSGWRQSELQLNQTARHLLDLVDFPTQSPFLSAADGRALYIGSGWRNWTGMDSNAVASGRWLEAVHADERAAVKQAWADALVSGEPYSREFRVRFKDGRYRWLRASAFPSRDDEGLITHWAGILEDIHDRRVAEEQLRQTATLLEMIGTSTDSIIYAKDRDGRMLYGNRALERLTGVSLADILGKTDAEWHPDLEEAMALQAVDRMVLATGNTQDIEELFTGGDGATRHYRSLKSPLRDRSGKVIGVVGVSTDITEAREAEQREKLLSREVDHRAKNLLAVVQSVVALTRAQSLGEFKAAVEGRILALGRAHSMLAASRWEGADLQRLLTEELAPYRDSEHGRFHLAGPSLLLKPAAAQSIGLIVHELATNAAKYGALSVPSGRLDVRWEVDGEGGDGGAPRLRFTWRESGGPPVAQREGRHGEGFGSRLIRSSVERQLGGTLCSDWSEEGLTVRFEAVLDRSLTNPGAGPLGTDNDQRGGHASKPGRKSVA